LDNFLRNTLDNSLARRGQEAELSHNAPGGVAVPRIECIAPILNVADISRSLRFYVDILGFVNAPWGDDTFTLVSRDGCGIYLCQEGQGQRGTWLWIGIDDDRALDTYLQSKGVAVRMGPTNRPWALEIHLEDPDGHVLRFGSEPEKQD
jgi:catechol 2,3-dioxygenase-like lactoylglutathione lyase family enzyme